MAVLVAGSLQNVYASLDLYLQTTLIVGAGLAVRLHGTRRFVPPVDTPWVETHYDFLGLQSTFRRQVTRGALATERQGHLQLDIFQRARIFTTRYTTAAVRDRVMDAFPEGHIVPIYDIAGAGVDLPYVEVGAMILDATTEHVADTGQKSGVIQHVMQVATRYLEQFTR